MSVSLQVCRVGVRTSRCTSASSLSATLSSALSYPDFMARSMAREPFFATLVHRAWNWQVSSLFTKRSWFVHADRLKRSG